MGKRSMNLDCHPQRRWMGKDVYLEYRVSRGAKSKEPAFRICHSCVALYMDVAVGAGEARAVLAYVGPLRVTCAIHVACSGTFLVFSARESQFYFHIFVSVQCPSDLIKQSLLQSE